MKEIKSRIEISILVHTFYEKVRKEDVLGPIFNTIVNDWETHLNLLLDFWETQLFLVKKYKGNPLEAHVKVDTFFNHSINEKHFGIWLQLWFETIDTLFEGEKAQLAKNRARNMSTFMNIEIFNSRKKTNS
ncbi:MAG: group III truncated hemoglobin [Flavobacteriales bacterium]